MSGLAGAAQRSGGGAACCRPSRRHDDATLATARPPQLSAIRRAGQAEPALPDGLDGHLPARRQFHGGQLVAVVAARRHEGVLAVPRRENIQRQIGQHDLLPRRRHPPAVGKQKPGISLAGEQAGPDFLLRMALLRPDCQSHDH